LWINYYQAFIAQLSLLKYKFLSKNASFAYNQKAIFNNMHHEFTQNQGDTRCRYFFYFFSGNWKPEI